VFDYRPDSVLHAFHFQHNITPTPTLVFLLRASRSTPACHLSSNKWLTSWSAPTTIGTIGPEFCPGDAQKGRRSSRRLSFPRHSHSQLPKRLRRYLGE
jgi:hypothetical protein